jgi:hypothetical protein
MMIVGFRSLSKPPVKIENFHTVGFPNGTKLYVQDGCNQTDHDYIVQQFSEQQWGRRTVEFVVFSVMPCVVLFILGYVLLWVGRGFRLA